MHIQKWFANLLFIIGLSALTASAAPMGIMVPAYFYPTPDGYWSELNFAATRVPLVVIMNPDSGPGKSKDEVYVQALEKLHHAGGKSVGYIHTSYGARPLAEVKQEIDLYLLFYALDGFFIDEMTNDKIPAHVDYYAAHYQYIKAQGANYTVTGNPGSNTQEEYLKRPTDDCFMIFEDNRTNYTDFTPASWVIRHPAQQFAQLPYDVTNASAMSNHVELAMSRNAGWIYITDDKLPNPYNTLPAYWTNEVNLVRSLNHGDSQAVINSTTRLNK